MSAAASISKDIGVVAACDAFSIPRATFYRQHKKQTLTEKKTQMRAAPPLALSKEEQQTVLDTLHSERFVDKAPHQVYAQLLDEGVYQCSIRTMYRLLKKHHGAVKERRRQVQRPSYTKPELLATEANQVWSWDITKLKCTIKWTYFYLYVIIDIFSRYVVGWMVAHSERTSLAKQLIDQTCQKQQIVPGQLLLHADRGSSMKSKGVAELLCDLGVSKTHSRPHVSNDNPFSEAHFRTLKYCPTFPDRFGSIEDARAFCIDFFNYYIKEHCHTGIGLMTPQQVHYGLANQIYNDRSQVLQRAFEQQPNRFKGKRPVPPEIPKETWINKPNPEKDEKIRV
jgi:putative transposase